MVLYCPQNYPYFRINIDTVMKEWPQCTDRLLLVLSIYIEIKKG